MIFVSEPALRCMCLPVFSPGPSARRYQTLFPPCLRDDHPFSGLAEIPVVVLCSSAALASLISATIASRVRGRSVSPSSFP